MVRKQTRDMWVRGMTKTLRSSQYAAEILLSMLRNKDRKDWRESIASADREIKKEWREQIRQNLRYQREIVKNWEKLSKEKIFEGGPAVTPVDVTLVDAGDRKISVIKVVRELTSLGFPEAKDLIEAAPTVVKAAVSRREAEEIKRRFALVGAKVTIK